MKNFGNLDIPHGQRKNYRKTSYFLGVMLNENGGRFVDDGIDLRNCTYAQFGRAVLQPPGQRAWYIFDAKVSDLFPLTTVSMTRILTRRTQPFLLLNNGKPAGRPASVTVEMTSNSREIACHLAR